MTNKDGWPWPPVSCFIRLEQTGVGAGSYRAPDIEARNSEFALLLLIFSSSNSIACFSTVESGFNTFRSSGH